MPVELHGLASISLVYGGAVAFFLSDQPACISSHEVLQRKQLEILALRMSIERPWHATLQGMLEETIQKNKEA